MFDYVILGSFLKKKMFICCPLMGRQFFTSFFTLGLCVSYVLTQKYK